MKMNVRNRSGFGPLCCIGLALLSSCNPVAHRFTEVTAYAGIDFMYNFGDYTYENILESSGSGVTVFDYDGDGWMDLYMMNGTWLEGISDEEGKVFENTPNRLYHNQGNGTFADVTEQSGLGKVPPDTLSIQGAWFDYDNDGLLDLVLSNYTRPIYGAND